MERKNFFEELTELFQNGDIGRRDFLRLAAAAWEMGKGEALSDSMFNPTKEFVIFSFTYYKFWKICMCSRDVAQVEHAAGLFENSEQAGSMFYSFCPSTDKCVTSPGPLQNFGK